MEIGKQIRKYRTEQKLSQDELAERIYVSRQSISNWENGRNYPDIRSLVLLGNVFGVSLDILVKGDLKEMKEQIKEADKKRFARDSVVFTVLFVAIIVLPVPLAWFFSWYGMAAWGVTVSVALYWAGRIERQKKAFDIQTYREIVAFSEGEQLDEAQKNQEIGKRPYQTVAYVLGTVVVTLAVAAVEILVLRML